MSSDEQREHYRFSTAIALGIVFVLWITNPLPATVSSNAVFRRVNWPDRGSIHIYMSNDGTEEVRLCKISVDDRFTFEVSESGFQAHADPSEILEDIAGISSSRGRPPLILRDYIGGH